MSDTQMAAATAPKYTTTTDRHSDVEVVITRTFDAPARIVFEAWTTPELLMRWWTPASFGITFISCEADVRTGGTYRFVMGHPSFDQPMAFHGRYLEVVPGEKIVWTNEEGEDGAISTVTFVEKDGKTRLTFTEVYPSKEALDESLGGMEGAPEQFAQLDELLVTLIASRA